MANSEPASNPANPASIPANPVKELRELQHGSVSTGPLVLKWPFRNDVGFANVIMNADGSYLFSGEYKKTVPDKDFEIVFAVKSKLG
jgi:hypothetical protein